MAVPKTHSLSRVVSVREAARILGCSRATVARWRRNGVLTAFRQIGPARVGILESDLAAFLDSRPRPLGDGTGAAPREAA